MSKNIAISDDVYGRLKREKGDRSFSEVIAEYLNEGGTLADVTGEQVLDAGTGTSVKEDVRRPSQKTVERLDE